jgi:pimeloyl-ACP methyl ester carboxylesterase
MTQTNAAGAGLQKILDAWFDAWNANDLDRVMPTRFLLCRDDRFFPSEFMRRVVRERLGITPDEIDGSHCVALSRPKELADRLEAYLAERKEPSSRPR